MDNEELYKQLQRAKTENEELKKLCDNKDELLTSTTRKSVELQAENDILRQYRGSKQASYENMQRCWQESEKARRKLEKENERLKDFLNHSFCDCELNEKYRQALQEIKDITEEDCKQCFEIDGFSKPDDCGICDYKRILDKINEVIGAEE